MANNSQNMSCNELLELEFTDSASETGSNPGDLDLSNEEPSDDEGEREQLIDMPSTTKLSSKKIRSVLPEDPLSINSKLANDGSDDIECCQETCQDQKSPFDCPYCPFQTSVLLDWVKHKASCNVISSDEDCGQLQNKYETEEYKKQPLIKVKPDYKLKRPLEPDGCPLEVKEGRGSTLIIDCKSITNRLSVEDNLLELLKLPKEKKYRITLKKVPQKSFEFKSTYQKIDLPNDILIKDVRSLRGRSRSNVSESDPNRFSAKSGIRVDDFEASVTKMKRSLYEVDARNMFRKIGDAKKKISTPRENFSQKRPSEYNFRGKTRTVVFSSKPSRLDSIRIDAQKRLSVSKKPLSASSIEVQGNIEDGKKIIIPTREKLTTPLNPIVYNAKLRTPTSERVNSEKTSSTKQKKILSNKPTLFHNIIEVDIKKVLASKALSEELISPIEVGDKKQCENEYTKPELDLMDNDVLKKIRGEIDRHSLADHNYHRINFFQKFGVPLIQSNKMKSSEIIGHLRSKLNAKFLENFKNYPEQWVAFNLAKRLESIQKTGTKYGVLSPAISRERKKLKRLSFNEFQLINQIENEEEELNFNLSLYEVSLSNIETLPMSSQSKK